MLVLVLIVGVIAPRSAEAESPLQRMNELLEAARKRIAHLKEEAKKDPREHLLAAYRNYTAEDFKDKKREVKAKTIIEWIFDPDKEKTHIDFRQACINALGEKSYFDPDLDSTRKGSRMSKRAKLCSTKKFLSRLKDDEAMFRKLTQELLEKLWGKQNGFAGIRNYKHGQTFDRTWGPAIKDWDKFLGSK
jgi:hypothetical protein